MIADLEHIRRQVSLGSKDCLLSFALCISGEKESRTEQDVVTAAKHDDRIARATYEIDIHNPA
ncbi:MAG: hypothetical protein E7632_07075, partial [Ruminococcaceae bacterium]|nr:hypothetical protein [Oscillospiraceae bacterium]